MVEQWHSALRKNLQSETAQENIERMGAVERRPLDLYRYERIGSPESYSPVVWFTLLTRPCAALTAVAVRVEDLVAALKQGGLPCTTEELIIVLRLCPAGHCQVTMFATHASGSEDVNSAEA